MKQTQSVYCMLLETELFKLCDIRTYTVVKVRGGPGGGGSAHPASTWAPPAEI